MNRGGWPSALLGGGLLWTAATLASGNREPWDSDLYWIVFLPLAVILAAALGALYPERAWRWAVGIMLMQLPVMLVLTSSGFGLLPFGIVLLLALAIPGMLAGMLGAAVRNRLGQ